MSHLEFLNPKSYQLLVFYSTFFLNRPPSKQENPCRSWSSKIFFSAFSHLSDVVVLQTILRRSIGNQWQSFEVYLVPLCLGCLSVFLSWCLLSIHRVDFGYIWGQTGISMLNKGVLIGICLFRVNRGGVYRCIQVVNGVCYWGFYEKVSLSCHAQRIDRQSPMNEFTGYTPRTLFYEISCIRKIRQQCLYL